MVVNIGVRIFMHLLQNLGNELWHQHLVDDMPDAIGR